MKSKRQIEEYVEAAMNSLEGLQPATANPFLFTWIQQRIANKHYAESYGAVMYRLAIAIVIFLIVNVFSYGKMMDSNTADNTSENSIEAFATDYGLTDNSTNIN